MWRRALNGVVIVLLRPLAFLLYGLSWFTPRNPRRWAFGSWSGYRFTDNSAALYEHVLQRSEPDLEPIWISRDRAIVRALRRRGARAHGAFTPAGLWACATAGVFVFDGLTKDINHWLSAGARRVLLRHGVGIKKIERAIDSKSHRLYKLFHGNVLQRLLWRYLIPWHTVRPDLVIATSRDHARQGELYFGVPEHRVKVTGFPRNDRLLSAERGPLTEAIRPFIEQSRERGRKVFLYLPTFRDDAARLPFTWRDLDAVAKRAGVHVLVKLHYVDHARGLDSDFVHGENLALASAKEDPSTFFHHVDGLISDFSSVVYDFILTRKPVLFYVPDYERFLQARTLYYDFEDVTPGPKARTLRELEDALSHSSREGRGTWTRKYEEVLERFHELQDARSCERTFQEIHERFLGQSPSGVSEVSEREGEDEVGSFVAEEARAETDAYCHHGS